MDYLKLASLYVGIEVTLSEVSFIDHSDGNGIQIKYWNIPDKPQPTIAELEALQPQLDIIENNEKILAEIIELDSKRSRAFFEPSEKEVGLTWLDYYNQEILKLRALMV